MINFSSLRGKVGNFLRIILRLFPYRGTLPILQGPVKGKLWKRVFGNDGYWLGSYEMEVQKTFIKYVKEASVVYDIGANAGFFILLASSLAKNGKVYGFEPDTRNLKMLKWVVNKNKISNVEIFDFAISDNNGELKFLQKENSSLSKIDSNGSTIVKCRTIDSLVENKEILPPNFIKIDTEGHTDNVLQGAKKTIIKTKPIMVVETSSFSFLKSLGYKCRKLDEGGNFLFYIKPL